MLLLNKDKLQRYINRLSSYQMSINDIPEEYRTDEICDIYIKRYINSDRFDINVIPATYNGRYMTFIKRRFIEKYSDNLLMYRVKFKDIPEEYRTDEICDIYIFLCMRKFEQKYGKWKVSNCECWGYDGYEMFLKDTDVDFDMSLIPIMYSGKYSKFIVYVDTIGGMAFKSDIQRASKWDVKKAYLAEPGYFHDQVSSYNYFINSKDTFDIGIIPEEYRTEEMCECYFTQVGKNIDLSLVPMIYRTKEMVDTYLDRVNDDFDISLIPQEFIDKQLVDKYVLKHPNSFDLSKIPEMYRSNKLCRKYIRSFSIYNSVYESLMIDLINGKEVPNGFREFRVDAIPTTYNNILDVYIMYANMAPNTFKIEYISSDYVVEFLWTLYGNGKSLDDFDISLIPIKHRSKSVCDFYVSKNEDNFDIRVIPLECRSINICKKYINNNIDNFNLGLVPLSNRTKWMVDTYVSNVNNFNLRYIPEELRTMEIVKKYLENNPEHYDIDLIPEKFINPIFMHVMYEDAVRYRDILQRDVTMRAFKALIRANSEDRVNGYAWIMKRYIRNKILYGDYEIAHTTLDETEGLRSCMSLKLASSPKTLLSESLVNVDDNFIDSFNGFIKTLGSVIDFEDKCERTKREQEHSFKSIEAFLQTWKEVNETNQKLTFSDDHEKLVEELENKFESK